jgi:hypothetical protein
MAVNMNSWGSAMRTVHAADPGVGFQESPRREARASTESVQAINVRFKRCTCSLPP